MFPITYQKLKAAWLDQERVPKTTLRVAREERLEQRAEVGRPVLEVGVEDRREVPGRVLEPRLERRAFAAVALVEDERHVSGQLAFVRSSRVPSVDPSSMTTS